MSLAWFKFRIYGHPNVKGTHRTTLEFTKEDFLTPRGDCIIGIRAEASVSDLPIWIKEGIWQSKPVVLVVCVGDLCDAIVGKGDPGLTLKDNMRMIIRKSTHKDEKTLMIRANKSAKDIDRRIIELLKRGAVGTVYISIID